MCTPNCSPQNLLFGFGYWQKAFIFYLLSSSIDKDFLFFFFFPLANSITIFLGGFFFFFNLLEIGGEKIKIFRSYVLIPQLFFFYFFPTPSWLFLFPMNFLSAARKNKNSKWIEAWRGGKKKMGVDVWKIKRT